MEPELFRLARRMYEAFIDTPGFNATAQVEVAWLATRDGWLRAAMLARPDLAEGLSVPAGHWAAGVLPCR